MDETAKRLPAGERRSLILAAGASLFGELGYDGVTLERIAEAAGVTKPIVYRHFGSKKDLYMALLARHRDDLPSFTAAAEGNEDEVRAILDGWLTYAAANAHAWQMLFRDHGGDADVVAFRRAVQEGAREVMADYLARVSPDPIPADELAARAEIVRGGLAALIVWWAEHPEIRQTALLDAARHLFA